MSFNPNIPQPSDELSDSQGDILTNFSTSNTSFGIDHYPFADLTANNGKHKWVTTPLTPGGTHPATAVNEPKLYGMQDTVPLGVIQYSRLGNNAVPSPVSNIESPATPIVLANLATTNVLDFTGLARAMGTVYVSDFGALGTPICIGDFRYNGPIIGLKFSILNTFSGIGTAPFTVTQSGDILQIQNTSGLARNDVYWTLVLHRVEV